CKENLTTECTENHRVFSILFSMPSVVYFFSKSKCIGSIPAPLKKTIFSTGNDDCSVINPFRSGDNPLTHVHFLVRTHGSVDTFWEWIILRHL
ncbi:MAG TPA: hypothetical protein PK813_12620, partial [Candidatus Hydrogenedens sp.]|nr:hypothetical protein [Candidatus Hydrogenedens sp.]